MESKIREVIPENERDLIVDNIGLPARAYNLAFADGHTEARRGGQVVHDGWAAYPQTDPIWTADPEGNPNVE